MSAAPILDADWQDWTPATPAPDAPALHIKWVPRGQFDARANVALFRRFFTRPGTGTYSVQVRADRHAVRVRFGENGSFKTTIRKKSPGLYLAALGQCLRELGEARRTRVVSGKQITLLDDGFAFEIERIEPLQICEPPNAATAPPSEAEASDPPTTTPAHANAPGAFPAEGKRRGGIIKDATLEDAVLRVWRKKGEIKPILQHLFGSPRWALEDRSADNIRRILREHGIEIEPKRKGRPRATPAVAPPQGPTPSEPPNPWNFKPGEVDEIIAQVKADASSMLQQLPAVTSATLAMQTISDMAAGYSDEDVLAQSLVPSKARKLVEDLECRRVARLLSAVDSKRRDLAQAFRVAILSELRRREIKDGAL